MTANLLHSPQPIGLAAVPSQPPRLLDLLRESARNRGHLPATIDAFVVWTTRLILFHGKRHPRELAIGEVGRFLDQVVHTEKDPLVALAAARQALDFLYREVLGIDLGELPHPRPPRLLDQVRQVLRVRHYSPRTEDCYVAWIKRYILFHDKRHPRELGAAEIEQFCHHCGGPGFCGVVPGASTPHSVLRCRAIRRASSLLTRYRSAAKA